MRPFSIGQRLVIQSTLNLMMGMLLCWLFASPWLATVAMLPLVAASASIHPPAYRYTFTLYVAMGLGGEIASVTAGIWHYPHVTFAGIPVFIPLAWGMVAIHVAVVHEAMTGYLKRA